jgi:hypothetical protein
MIKYKLTDENMCTYNGTQWEIGVQHSLTIDGNLLCSNQVFHFYHSPEQAIFLNSTCTQIPAPRLFECEVENVVVEDGIKGGCKTLTLVKEIPLPEFSINQRIEIAIRCVLEVYDESEFVVWAKNWLSGRDRSKEVATIVAGIAYSIYSANSPYVVVAYNGDTALRGTTAFSAYSVARSVVCVADSVYLAVNNDYIDVGAVYSANSVVYAFNGNKNIDLQKIIMDVLQSGPCSTCDETCKGAPVCKKGSLRFG